MKLQLCELGDSGIDEMPTYSPFTLKIHRALQLHGLDYERLAGTHPGSWKHLNPRGQIPVLLADDEPVFDSTAILRRLEEISSRSLVPVSSDDAARAWLMEDWADQSLNGFVVAARWADDRNWPVVRERFFGGMPAPLRLLIPDRQRRAIVKSLVARDIWRGGAAQCWSRLEFLLDHLDESAPETGFWVGSRPSVADVALYGQLQSLTADITPWQRDLVRARARLSDYLDRVHVAEPLVALRNAS